MPKKQTVIQLCPEAQTKPQAAIRLRFGMEGPTGRQTQRGGESGIRTHGSCESPVFKTGSLNHSDISPYESRIPDTNGIIPHMLRFVNLNFALFPPRFGPSSLLSLRLRPIFIFSAHRKIWDSIIYFITISCFLT